MKQALMNIPDENFSLVKQLIEKLGGDVEIKKEAKEATKKVNGKKKAEAQKVPVDFLFGKWADMDIDPKTWRKKVWRRK